MKLENEQSDIILFHYNLILLTVRKFMKRYWISIDGRIIAHNMESGTLKQCRGWWFFFINFCPFPISIAHDTDREQCSLGAYPISSRANIYRGIVCVGVVHQVEIGLTG